MATITGVVPAPDRPGHVVILVDGKPFAVVPAADAPREGGGVGLGSDATLAMLPPMDEPTKKTYARALGLLSHRPRSRRELARRLVEKGEPEAQVAASIERLSAHGYVDDARYAESRARAGLLGKARSVRRVEHDLRNAGVASEVAMAAVRRAMADAGTSERQVAEQAARKKLRSLAKLPPDEQRKKLFAFLARKAFGADVVRSVVSALLARGASDDDLPFDE